MFVKPVAKVLITDNLFAQVCSFMVMEVYFEEQTWSEGLNSGVGEKGLRCTSLLRYHLNTEGGPPI